jgi:uncharacterized SAM-binding protein YcdF (DUF218 family)
MDYLRKIGNHLRRHPIKYSLLVICALLFIARNSLLHAMGNFLFAEDTSQPTTWYVVLGGNSPERSIAGYGVYKMDSRAQFLCTGANEPAQLAAIGIYTTEADLTCRAMKKLGVDSTHVHPFPFGTSSQEEAEALKNWALKNNVKAITLISGQYHLRRLHWSYDSLFESAGIHVYYLGAKEKNFDLEQWWHTESGLITTFLEYSKLFYYIVKY